jgi:hypothetical protein
MCAFAFGAWTGVRISLIPPRWKTASKARLNFASRSWIRNRRRWWMSTSRLRACCSIQAPSGLLAQATYSIRRPPKQMKTSTYSRRSNTCRRSGSRRRASLQRAGARTSASPAGRARVPAEHLPLSGCCVPTRRRRRCRVCTTRRRSGHSPNWCSRAPFAGRLRAPRRRSAVGRDAGAGTSSSTGRGAMPAQQRLRPH